MITKRFITGSVAAASALLLAGTQPTGAQTTLQILHASDLEGGVNAIEDAPNFAAVVEGLENAAATAGVPSILLSAGDNYIPGPFFSAAGDPSVQPVLRSVYEQLFGLAPGTLSNLRTLEGRADITVMNAIGFDASALGNHEFDPGTPALGGIIRPDVSSGTALNQVRWFGAQFPYLSANLDFSADTALNPAFTASILDSASFQTTPANVASAATAKKLAPATIINRGGQLFGVVGATTPLLASISSPGQTKVKTPGAGSNNMTQLASLLQPVIDELLAAGVNRIILVTHLQQITLEQQLVPLLRGVDVAIAGGSDTLLADATDVLRAGDVAGGPYPILTANADGDSAVIVSTDGQYSYVGRLVVQFDAAGRVVPASVDANVSGAFKTDDAGVQAVWGNLNDPFLPGTKGALVKTLTDAVKAVVIAKDASVFGKSDVFLEGRRAVVRTEESNLGNLSADANLWIAQLNDPTVSVSLKNGGGIRDLIGFIDGTTGELLPTQANPLSGKEEKEVSQLDIENTLRFNNGLTLVTVTAAELLQILEHSVAATAPGATPGQFPQVGGISFSFDASQPAQSRIRSAAIKDWWGNTVDVIKQDGVTMGDPNRPIRMVTLNFLASGGDNYPFPALAENRVDLLKQPADPRTGVAAFAPDGSEQDAIAEFFTAFHPNSAFAYNLPEISAGQDARIQNLSRRSDSVIYPPAPPPGAIKLSLIGRYTTGVYDEGAAEITAFDKRSKRVFVVNANGATVDILNLEDPTKPALLKTIDIGAMFGDAKAEASPNSVAVSDGLVAVAVQRTDEDGRQLPGLVAFFDTNGQLIDDAQAGALPDMVTFTPNGLWVLTANEGEPSADYSFDPEGSITIINVKHVRLAMCYPRFARFFKLPPGQVRHATFTGFNPKKRELLAAGVRIYGPNASVAQDLEPEYIAVDDKSLLAYVTLQENNAVAIVNILTAKVLKIAPLGYKDWTQSGLDASDRDGAINIGAWPVLGMYEPDAIASYRKGQNTYLVTANEGDARDYETFAEEARVSSLKLDETAFPDGAALKQNAAIGRLNVTSTLGDPDKDGDYDQLHALGGRSFSIWRVNHDGSLTQTFDSADQFEQITASLLPGPFNSDNAENDSFDTRSDNKGPEPEGVTLGEVNGRTYAFIGLERAGGVMVYDISDPAASKFVQYINPRDFDGDAEGGTAGDLGPEGLQFVPACDSPTGKPLLIVAHEISGSVVIFQVE
jgi:alkaline phosphatase